jgi:hypothetical protein
MTLAHEAAAVQADSSLDAHYRSATARFLEAP